MVVIEARMREGLVDSKNGILRESFDSGEHTFNRLFSV